MSTVAKRSGCIWQTAVASTGHTLAHTDTAFQSNTPQLFRAQEKFYSNVHHSKTSNITQINIMTYCPRKAVQTNMKGTMDQEGTHLLT